MSRSPEKDRLRKDLQTTGSIRGIEITLKAGYSGRAYFEVAGHMADTLDEAVKKARYLAAKNAKLKDPIPVLSLQGRTWDAADITQITDTDFTVKNYETEVSDKITSYRAKLFYADTPANKNIMGQMIALWKDQSKLEDKISSLKSQLTHPDEIKKFVDKKF